MKKWLLRISLSIAVLAGALLLSVYIYLQHPKFGELPSGVRLNTIKASPHYANGRFQNLVPTPILVGDSGLAAGLLSYFPNSSERLTPDGALPSVKTNLNELDRNKDVLVWLGHSSYYVQLGGVRVLVDPVLSLSAAPIPFLNDAFEGTSIYTAEDTPSRRVFLSGDTGFGPHFADIGRRFGGFDLVALDSGQYSPHWPLIHMTPDEVVRAAEALNVKALLPGHVGKFRLARHPWDEPFERLTALSEGKSYRLVTPMIGEPVRLGNDQQHFSRWWQATR